jgi:hypothetical protein
MLNFIIQLDSGSTLPLRETTKSYSKLSNVQLKRHPGQILYRLLVAQTDTVPTYPALRRDLCDTGMLSFI